MADATQFQGKFFRVKRSSRVEPAERDFSRTHETEVRFLDTVNLRLGSPWHEADSFENLVLCQVATYPAAV